MPDAYVTAHHLRDMLNEVSVEQLIAWSDEPGLLARVPSGPDRGKDWDQISLESLATLSQHRDAHVRLMALTELQKRGEGTQVTAEDRAQGMLF